MITTEIICPQLNNSRGLEILFGQLCSVPEYSEKVSLVFRNVDFITPSGALALTLITQELQRRRKLIMLSEVNPVVLSYLERIDYFNIFSDGIILSTGNSSFQHLGRSQRSHNLLEITEIPHHELTNAYVQTLLLPRAEIVLMNSFANEASSIEKILTMISEITGNIIHSKDRGYCTIQTYSNQGRGLIRIAIGDLGIGIKESLLEYNHLPFKEELDFIVHALKYGTSSKEGARGLGLAGVYESIKGLSGSFLIRSGTAGVSLQGLNMKTYTDLQFVPGTQVEMFIQQAS